MMLTRPFYTSLFFKLALGFFLLLLPLFAIIAGMQIAGAKKLEQLLSDSLNRRIEFYLADFEKEYARIGTMQQEYFVDVDLMNLSISSERMSPYERLVAYTNLQHSLRMTVASSEYIDQARIYIVNVNRIIGSTEFISDVNLDLYRRLVDGSTEGISIYADDEKLTINKSGPSLSLSPYLPLYILSVRLSTIHIQRLLDRIVLPYEGMAAIISNNGDFVFPNELSTLITAWRSVGSRDEQTLLKYDLDEYVSASLSSATLGFELVAIVARDNIYGSIQQFQFWFWLSIAAVMVIMAIFALLSFRIVHRPVRTLVSAFETLEQGRMDTRVSHISNDEFGYLYQRFNQMVLRLQKLIETAYEQRIRAQQSELKRLENQINPHFLYNSLFVLRRMIAPLGDKRATEFARNLAMYFRFVTRNAEDETTIAREVEYARSYVEIQQACFGDRFQVEFPDIESGIAECKIPRLILQPVIENAYKYALEPRESGGHLRITFSNSEQKRNLTKTSPKLVILVDDDGPAGGAEIAALRACTESLCENIQTTGLVNVHRRLQARFGPNSGLQFEKSPLGGLRVLLRL